MDHVLREMARANAYFVCKEEQALKALQQVQASAEFIMAMYREREAKLSGTACAAAMSKASFDMVEESPTTSTAHIWQSGGPNWEDSADAPPFIASFFQVPGPWSSWLCERC